MNKTRKPLDNQNRKKQAKEVKKGQKILSEPEELSRTDTLTVAKALKKLPSKTKKADKALVESLVKNMEVKKTKLNAKHSKRTTPSEIDTHESAPAYVHKEGARWEKTVVKQSVGKGKALTSKIVKRATKTPKAAAPKRNK